MYERSSAHTAGLVARLIAFAALIAALVSLWYQRQRVQMLLEFKRTLPFNPIRSMAYVPGGDFLMGSSNGAPEELPVHTVHVAPFWMDRYEVTNAEFERFDPSHRALRTRASTNDHHPAVNVTWHAAMAYCAWRCRREGVPDGTYRLPTEAEWECAARSGLVQLPYPWGAAAPDADDIILAAYKDHSATNGAAPRLMPVGSFLPNGFGLYDMAGNVWEWCLDWYADDTYARRAGAAAIENPRGPAEGLRKVWRGGSWMSDAERLRVSARGGISPAQWMETLGFRCVRPAQP